MADKQEAANKLAKSLEAQGILSVGNDGEIIVKTADQVRVANALEEAGFGMMLVSAKHKTGDEDANMFKIIAGPRSIKEIISKVVPDSREEIARRIKVDPVLRSVQMNMIAFD